MLAQCKFCKFFIAIGINAMCVHPRTFSATVIGVPIAKCEDERKTSHETGCGLEAKFFEARE